jgi:hypothetical protein
MSGWQARLLVGFCLGWQCFLLVLIPPAEWTPLAVGWRGLGIWCFFLLFEALIQGAKFLWRMRRYRIRLEKVG